MLEELVKKLPGAEIDDEGNVKINGKDLSKIMVDGKEFFGGDVKTGLKNLPVDMIEKLKTYDKKSDLARITGIDDGEEETVLDLYCGAGTIGLSMADKAEELIGIETVAPAIEDAKKNAAANGIENARFICADAGEAAEKLLGEGKRPEVIVLDPPRKGCSEQTVRAAAKMAPDRIVYVSCDPATLARDCAAFKELGYEVEEATPVDLFPRTAHVETVCLLSRAI